MSELGELLDRTGTVFLGFVLPIVIQSSLLVGILLLLDFLLASRVSAAFRYALWLLVLLRFVFPPGFAAPTGIGYWLSGPISSVGSRWGKRDREYASAAPDEKRIQGRKSPFPDGNRISAKSVFYGNRPGGRPKSESLSLSRKPIGFRSGSVSQPGIAFALYVLGVLAVAFAAVRRFRSTARLAAEAQPGPNALSSVAEWCARKVGLKRPIRVLVTEEACGPAVYGLLRPVILMPASLAESLKGRDLRNVILHETAHVKRLDNWVGVLETLLQVLYFFHPLLWFSVSRIRRLRELATDERVLSELGKTRNGYAETLVEIARFVAARAPSSLRASAIAESRSSLPERVERILSFAKPPRGRLGLGGVFVVCALAALLLPMAPGAQKCPPPPAVSSRSKAPGEKEEKGRHEENVGALRRYGEPGLDRKKIEKRLLECVVNLDFERRPLYHVLDFMHKVGRIPIVIAPSVDAKHISVSLRLKKVTMAEVFDLAALHTGLSWSIVENAVRFDPALPGKRREHPFKLRKDEESCRALIEERLAWTTVSSISARRSRRFRSSSEVSSSISWILSAASSRSPYQ